jgi:hypothetical protein
MSDGDPVQQKGELVTARRRDYSIRPVRHAEAAALVRAHHYARSASNTSVLSVGLYRGESLVGAAVWLPPTKPAAVSVDPDNWRRVICLSRVVVVPGEPKNAAGMLVAGALRLIACDSRWLVALTYADTAERHTGHLYRVTNWTYVGMTRPDTYYVDTAGKRVSKLATKSRSQAQMLALGYEPRRSPGKHKFIYRLRNVAKAAA